MSADTMASLFDPIRVQDLALSTGSARAVRSGALKVSAGEG